MIGPLFIRNRNAPNRTAEHRISENPGTSGFPFHASQENAAQPLPGTARRDRQQQTAPVQGIPAQYTTIFIVLTWECKPFLHV
ncbi:hypothetical protein NZA98_03150, partial [Escherichia coli]|nr:hypothetical protein [Escherichia coli]